jgi:hypothetical protein
MRRLSAESASRPSICGSHVCARLIGRSVTEKRHNFEFGCASLCKASSTCLSQAMRACFWVDVGNFPHLVLEPVAEGFRLVAATLGVGQEELGITIKSLQCQRKAPAADPTRASPPGGSSGG